jgi:PadR family transcriptional regulator
MGARIRMTNAVGKVLAALLVDPDQPRYGLDLMRATGQPSGTLYPILARLVGAGWAVAEWESAHAASEDGRPARRYYRLTDCGLAAARAALGDPVGAARESA